MKLKIGDQVLITIGKDKGRNGTVERLLVKQDRVVVGGVNMYKRHKKGTMGKKGEIMELARPLSMAKVALVCPNCKKPTRVGYQMLKDGEKVRICKKCKRQLDVKKEK